MYLCTYVYVHVSIYHLGPLRYTHPGLAFFYFFFSAFLLVRLNVIWFDNERPKTEVMRPNRLHAAADRRAMRKVTFTQYVRLQ